MTNQSGNNQLAGWAQRLETATRLSAAAAVLLPIASFKGVVHGTVPFPLALLLGCVAAHYWAAPGVLRSIAKTQDAETARVVLRGLRRDGNSWIVTLVVTRGVRAFSWEELVRQVQMVTGAAASVREQDDRRVRLMVHPKRPLQVVADTFGSFNQRNR